MLASRVLPLDIENRLVGCRCRRSLGALKTPRPPLRRDDLKALGFVCRYADKEWELPERYCSEQKERQLRYLLREGELPPESDGEGAAAANAPQGGAAAAAGARAAVPATPEGGRKRQREREPGGTACLLPPAVGQCACIEDRPAACHCYPPAPTPCF